MRFFVTGAAGFIGFHLAVRLLADGHVVHGFDAMTPYYDDGLKAERLASLLQSATYVHHTQRLEDYSALHDALEASAADAIIHLGAQAGVQCSLDRPGVYMDANVIGSFNLLEAARHLKPAHLILASTSSVYGANDKLPFEENDRTDEPLTLYAATKKSMEVMAHAYAHLWQIPTTIVRLFTVYGPHCRPDMAMSKFVRNAFEGARVEVYAPDGQSRDFTYIDDVVEAIVRLVPLAPGEVNRAAGQAHDTLSTVAPYRIVNIGNGKAVGMTALVEAVEEATGARLVKTVLPHRRGDIAHTRAATGLLQALVGFVPHTPISTGISACAAWIRSRLDTGLDRRNASQTTPKAKNDA